MTGIPKILKDILSVILGLGAGLVISGAVFAFIAIIGIVPRLAQKTHTQKYIKFYEEAIVIGGVFGATTELFDYRIKVGWLTIVILFFLVGIFVGCLAVSLAETLDVIPILTRRSRLQKGMFFFILSLAVGKLIGSVLYFAIPGFFGS